MLCIQYVFKVYSVLLQIEDMRCKLNVTLLKAVLQIHQLVAVMDDQLSRGNSDPKIMDFGVAELAVEEEIRWKQNQVTAMVVALCASLQLVDTPRT